MKNSPVNSRRCRALFSQHVDDHKSQNGQAQGDRQEDVEPRKLLENVTHCFFRLSVTKRQQTD